MTTVWITIACLVVVLAAWRLRKAGRTMRRILDEERAQTQRREDAPVEQDGDQAERSAPRRRRSAR